MSGSRLAPETVSRVVAAALAEDLGATGDLTTRSVVPEGRAGQGRIVARQALILCGVELAREVFRQTGPDLIFRAEKQDGDRLDAGETAVLVEGGVRGILVGERTALNFLMRMSGIATATRQAVDEIEGSGARILDTRKTAPGLRALDKHAVACGGGLNHRMGLYDAVMIKDTHLDSGSSIADAIGRALGSGVPATKITAEVRDVEQLEQAIAARAGRALLDNMDVDRMREAVRVAAGRIVLEASGGMRPGRLRQVAETGVDFLSLGWLTHSAPAADLALEMETPP